MRCLQVTLSVWDDGKLAPEELFSVRLDPTQAVQRNPFSDKKWRNFQISKFFGGGSTSSRVQPIGVLTKDGPHRPPVLDMWLLAHSLGSGHTRDMALDRWVSSLDML